MKTESPKTRERQVIATNKKAYYQFEVVNKFTAGIKLVGTEVKAVRFGKVSMGDSYCYFNRGELWVKSLHIAEYNKGNLQNHEPRRERKLLLHKRELKRLHAAMKEKGFTIVPTELFISERNLIKLEIALVRGKKRHDKRNSIKDKDMKRDLDRAKASRYQY